MFDLFAKNTLVPLLVRLGLAVVFIYHGMQKVNGPGHEGGMNWMQKPADPPDAPEPPPAAVQAAVAYGELIGGLALAVGFLTRLAALGIALIMGGAIYTVTGASGFDLMKHGYEYNFVLLVLCACAFLLGGGTLAADRVFRLRKR
jgi:putative oxidoreductase